MRFSRTETQWKERAERAEADLVNLRQQMEYLRANGNWPLSEVMAERDRLRTRVDYLEEIERQANIKHDDLFVEIERLRAIVKEDRAVEIQLRAEVEKLTEALQKIKDDSSYDSQSDPDTWALDKLDWIWDKSNEALRQHEERKESWKQHS